VQIGQYKVIDEIGGGGMGRVRLARDASGRLVVLKNALRDHPDDDERLRDEARVGRFVRHPGLVDTIELIHIADGYNKQRPVLVTAFVPGVSLLELRNVGPLPPAVVCQIGRELGEAIDALHHATDNNGAPLGVIHRDVTAGNCLLGHDGHARLIDLGIASSKENRALRTEAGLLRGTLRYLAPELFDGGRYTTRSDLWALGVVLWEALLGRSAVLGTDAAAVGRICAGSIMILEDNEAPEPRVSHAISQLLHKDPLKRPQRGNDVAALFAAVERSLAVDGPAEMRRVVAAAISGVPLAPATSAPVPAQASTADIQVPVLSSSSSVKPPPLPPSATFGARSLSEYAAQLSSMEQAHASAWDSHSALERRRLATLPVVTGRLLVEDADGWLVEGATVELPMPPEFPMPPTTSARAIAAAAARARGNPQVD
jgi:serine/threonine protein kinase